jgi:hypothetical protein
MSFIGRIWLESQKRVGTTFSSQYKGSWNSLIYIDELSGDNLEFKTKLIGILKRTSKGNNRLLWRNGKY